MQRDIIMLVVLALLITAAFFPSLGTTDINVQLSWGNNTYKHGIVEGYALNQHENPPGLTCILWAVYKLAALFGIYVFYAIKVSFLPFLFASTVILYRWSKGNLPVTLFFYAILTYSCMTLSYVDIYFTPFLLLAFYMLHRGKSAQGMFAFTLACFIKYPPLIIFPFFIVFIIFLYVKHVDENSMRRQSYYSLLLPSGLLLILTFLVFGLEPLKALQRGVFGHNMLNAQALNLNWIIKRIIQLTTDTIPMVSRFNPIVNIIGDSQIDGTIKIISRVLFGGFYLSAFLLFLKRKKSLENLLLFSLLGHFSYFMFSIGVHENHLYLSCLLTAALFCINPAYLYLAVGLSAISSINMFFFYGIDGRHIPMIFPPLNPKTCAYDPSWMNACYPFDIRLLLAIFNLGYFLSLWAVIIDKRQEINYGSTEKTDC